MNLLELKEHMGKREFDRFLSMVLHAEGKVLPLETPETRFDYGSWQVYCGNTTYDFSTCWKDGSEFKGYIVEYSQQGKEIVSKTISIEEIRRITGSF